MATRAEETFGNDLGSVFSSNSKWLLRFSTEHTDPKKIAYSSNLQPVSYRDASAVGVWPLPNADCSLMSDPSDVMRQQDEDIMHTPILLDAMATSPLSGSDENQNQVTQEQKRHWESTIRACGSRSTPSTCSPLRPGLPLLASLHSLAEHTDPTLLPRSLHQIAEAYFLEEDYRWAIHFLQLERLYHQRLLSNLGALQEQWESQWTVGGKPPRSGAAPPAGCTREESERMDSLRHICRTHQRPTLCMDKHMADQVQTDSLRLWKNVSLQQPVSCVEKEQKRMAAAAFSIPKRQQKQEEGYEEEYEEEEEEEQVDDEEDLWEEQEDEEEEGLQELLMGDCEMRGRGLGPVDNLAKCIQVEEMSPTNGLVSILKRRVSEEGEVSPTESFPKRTARRKVRFSEPSEDDASADSCLILVFLCLVTMVISIGGTALYCLLGNGGTAVCTDFSQNMAVYWGPVQSGVRWLTHWLFPVS